MVQVVLDTPSCIEFFKLYGVVCVVVQSTMK